MNQKKLFDEIIQSIDMDGLDEWLNHGYENLKILELNFNIIDSFNKEILRPLFIVLYKRLLPIKDKNILIKAMFPDTKIIDKLCDIFLKTYYVDLLMMDLTEDKSCINKAHYDKISRTVMIWKYFFIDFLKSRLITFS